MKIILHILEWGSGWLTEALKEELWEATVEKFGINEAVEVFNAHEVAVEIDGDYFIVSIGKEVCRCCGKGDETLALCPQCKELLCQRCAASVHMCEPE